MTIYLREHPQSNYQARTRLNAEKSDLTIAFTVDQYTAGEILTRKLATVEKYGHINLNDTTPIQAARHIKYMVENKLRDKPFDVLNIAGNGAYTMRKHGWTQEQVNKYVFETLHILRDQLAIMPSKGVRSGGQTGVDIAAAVACQALGVDAVITFPRGYRQRTAESVDITQSIDEVITSVDKMAKTLMDSLPPVVPAII